MRAVLLGCASLMLMCATATAQTQTAAPERGQDAAGSSLGKKVGNVFSQPLHPVVKGVASGGGIGAGIAYDFPRKRGWETSTEAVMTINGYWSTLLSTEYRTRRGSVEAYGRVRDMGQLAFFGPGTNSLADDRTHFGMREPIVGVLTSYRLSPWITVGARAEEIWPDLRGGTSSRFPSIETRFGDPDAPALSDQPRFGRYQAFIEAISDAGPAGARYQGGRSRMTFDIYDDQQLDRFNFRRLDLETKQQFTLFGPHRLLTLHGWVSTTDTSNGNDVPFFMQYTLGGRGNLRSVHEHLIGSDGTDATLRGFRTFRFRDRHLVLLQAEYRWPLWGPIDATVFMDAGKVTNRRSDLNLSDLKRNYGFSLNVVRGSGTVVRMDVGFGGGEGVHLFWTFGKSM